MVVGEPGATIQHPAKLQFSFLYILFVQFFYLIVYAQKSLVFFIKM